MLGVFDSTFAVLSGSTILGIVYYLLQRQRKARGSNPKCLPLPPGPRGLPLIGNTLQMPTTHYWVTYTDWAKIYGDIVYASVCGNDMVFLNSAEVALDLLEKRSSIYSDRPRLPMLNDLMGFSWTFTIMPYGQRWRQHRKTFHQYFHQGAVLKHVPVQVDEARRCLVNLLKEPDNVMRHLHQVFSASIFRVTYGLDVKAKDDQYLSKMEELMDGATVAGIPGAFLVDMLPILKYIPSWVPGAGFQRFARHYYDLQEPARIGPLDAVRNSMESENYLPQSMVSDYLANAKISNRDGDAATWQTQSAECLELIKNAAGMAFLAGADTTVSTLETLILALLLHPEAQKRAHEEIVEIIGPNRLPEFSDIESMPFVHAVVKEVLRWQPVAPLGLPHCIESTDEYNGYHIPKGATVIANIWAILHDERLYEDPYTFKPERFLLPDGSLNKDIPDPASYVFGFGRRICPGRHHAYNGALIVAASIISAFEIRAAAQSASMKPYDETREDISISLMTSGMISHPRTFACEIVPRSVIISGQLLERYDINSTGA